MAYSMSMKKLFTLMMLSLAVSAYADPLRTFVRIEKNHSETRVIRMVEGDHIPAIPANKEVKSKLESLPAGTEAMMEGHITYEQVTTDSPRHLRPFFVIERIQPLSLADLGEAGRKLPDTPPRVLLTENIIYQPVAFPVTTEVASAITLTTSMLLMEELTSGNTEPEGKRDLRKALFISAGATATMLFLYEQFTGKTRP